jgi:hypothetical protein
LERKECFGSIKEVVLPSGLTMIQTKPECRDCQQFRDCLRHSKQSVEEKYARLSIEEDKEKDELKKQEMITQIIDLSQVLSNEVGSCLLEFLNKTYSSPLGAGLFKTLLLFYELPQDTFSHTITVAVSPSTLDLMQVGEVKVRHPVDQTGASPGKGAREGIPVRIVLIQRSFSNNRKANMGLIAYEVARLFSSDSQGISQILEVLPDSEINQFKKMDAEGRTIWIMAKWGFLEELKAFKKEIALLKERKKD